MIKRNHTKEPEWILKWKAISKISWNDASLFVSHNMLGALLMAARAHGEAYANKHHDSDEYRETYEAECEAYNACLVERKST